MLKLLLKYTYNIYVSAKTFIVTLNYHFIENLYFLTCNIILTVNDVL